MLGEPCRKDGFCPATGTTLRQRLDRERQERAKQQLRGVRKPMPDHLAEYDKLTSQVGNQVVDASLMAIFSGFSPIGVLLEVDSGRVGQKIEQRLGADRAILEIGRNHYCRFCDSPFKESIPKPEENDTPLSLPEPRRLLKA